MKHRAAMVEPHSESLDFIESLYRDFVQDPASLTPAWRRYFQALTDGHPPAPPGGGPSFRPRGIFRPAEYRSDRHQEPVRSRSSPSGRRGVSSTARLQDRVDQLIRAFRVRGHIIARVNPLDLPQPRVPELEPAHYGFTAEDMDRIVSSRTVAGGNRRTLGQIIGQMRHTYCRSIGVQFMHIDDLAIRHWLQDRMEGTENRIHLDRREQLRILTQLTQAVVFEEFVQKKYVGAKSFSLEGCESLIPLLDLAIERAGEQGIQEIVIGMAHRGRLNVLANIMGKRPQAIFREFEDSGPTFQFGAGDVKYHLGCSGDWETVTGRKLHLSLCFNPSHLEHINPVALGRMRAKQDRVGDVHRRQGMVVLIHGDAGFAGEGIVQETLNLSELRAYTTGGAIHVIVNNQIGFTTPPSEGRSSIYATGVAKMLQVPIFHVNGEDPEAVAQVIRLALDFRREFKRDVVIDMYGYRRHGHNEGDEPSFTQPVLYRAIRDRKSVRDGYLEHLLELGDVNEEQADGIASLCREQLERGLAIARSDEFVPAEHAFSGIWSGYCGGPERQVMDVNTGVERDRLVALLRRLVELPDGFHLHPKLKRLMKTRQEMIDGEAPLDWAAAETLAFASLATEGIRVRLAGQDSARGTFSHRHAVLHDVGDGHTYEPLNHLAEGQAPVEIFNSPLCEAAALGFEYGYSLDCPDGLVIWEAQFGDFVNAAQVIVDQFLASAEDKWRRLSGVALLLPHGFEGQGPEHSSARMERFLLLAAEDNLQVVYPSTPAQLFHCLRRQVLRRWRKPLVLLTPKSLLRHKRVVSGFDELAEGTFQRVIGDDTVEPGKANRVLLCSGKVYYELLEERERLERDDVAILRLEQLYPLSPETLQAALARYPDDVPVFWVQEEPENMGAWRYLSSRYGKRLLGRLSFAGVCRPESASPATGSAQAHKVEQQHLIQKAFADAGGDT